MVHLSKSKYCGLWQCPKMAWLAKYKPEERKLTPDAESNMRDGNEVGDLAMGLFGDFVEVTAYDGEKLDLSEMIRRTKTEMKKGTPVICEASFVYNGLYCAVDILKKEENGWSLYEVKSSTDPAKQVYLADVAYQKYVLEHCGISLSGTYIVCIDNTYVFDGNLDLSKLFKITDVSDMLALEEGKIEPNLETAEIILNSKEEPEIDIDLRCQNPYLCGFWEYCTSDIPKPSVFDLYSLRFDKKIAYYKSGKVSFEDIEYEDLKNEKRTRQVDFALHDRGTYADKERIRKFLDDLSYPLYFLDFETMKMVIPRYIGTRPYEQIPVQYSLHYIEKPGGELMHKEFLAESGPDPRRKLAEQLTADIPTGVCVVAYNKSFECGVLKNLSDIFPDLSDHLLNIRENMADLLVPFRSGYYYNRAMGGSFSIKSVLPAVFPDDPSLDYHNLEDVHNGGEAMNIFPQIQFMEPDEQARVRKNLLKYCELDTFAMVKLWQELEKVSGHSEGS